MQSIRGTAHEGDLDYYTSMWNDALFAEPCPIGGNGLINPHVTRFHRKDGGYTSIFHVKPVYYEHISGDWRPMYEVAEFYGNKKIVLKHDWMEKMSLRYFSWLSKRQAIFDGGSLSVGGYSSIFLPALQPHNLVFATTLTEYPDPSPETTTCDGGVGVRDGGASWSTNQARATGTAIDDSSAFLGVYIGVGVKFPNDTHKYIIDRCHAGFDTSSISTDDIDDATFSLHAQSAGEIENDKSTGTDDIVICESTPASNTAVVVGDYDAIGDSVGSPTSWNTTAISSVNGTSYTDFTLNATGESNINKSGVTNIGIRGGDDITAEPSPTWVSGEGNRVVFESAEDGSGTKDPKLVVNHSAGGGAANTSNFFSFF